MEKKVLSSTYEKTFLTFPSPLPKKTLMAKLTLQSYQKRWEIKWKQRSWKQILRTTSPPPTFKLVRFLFSFSFFFLCVCVVRFLDKSRLVAWIQRENVFPSQLPKHYNLQKETCQRKLAGLQMLTPRGWGGGKEKEGKSGQEPKPFTDNLFIHSYIVLFKRAPRCMSFHAPFL